jgi:hypothetical protein
MWVCRAGSKNRVVLLPQRGSGKCVVEYRNLIRLRAACKPRSRQSGVEFINNPRLDSAVDQRNVHRRSTLALCFAVANSGLSDDCVSQNNADNTERLEGWLSPV